MPAHSSHPFPFDPAVVELLACPACLGDLRLDLDRLVCAGCGQAYPIVDGIPALITERAELGLIPGARPD
jgi:hypothetical protein